MNSMNNLDTLIEQTKQTILNSLGKKGGAGSAASSAFADMMAAILKEQTESAAADPTAAVNSGNGAGSKASASAVGRYEPSSMEIGAGWGGSMQHDAATRAVLDSLFGEGGDLAGWTLDDLNEGLHEDMVQFGTLVTQKPREIGIGFTYSPYAKGSWMKLCDQTALMQRGILVDPPDYSPRFREMSALAEKHGQNRELVDGIEDRFFSIAARSAITKLARQDPAFARAFEENPQEAIAAYSEPLVNSINNSKVEYEYDTGQTVLRF